MPSRAASDANAPERVADGTKESQVLPLALAHTSLNVMVLPTVVVDTSCKVVQSPDALAGHARLASVAQTVVYGGACGQGSRVCWTPQAPSVAVAAVRAGCTLDTHVCVSTDELRKLARSTVGTRPRPVLGFVFAGHTANTCAVRPRPSSVAQALIDAITCVHGV